MSLKSFSKWKILVLFLLISQSFKVTNANYDYNDEGNLFSKKKSPPKVSEIGAEATQAVRDYLDLLCMNWNGFFYLLGSNTPHTTQILNTYLQQVSAAYARVLELHDYNGDEVTRAIYNQFMGHIVPRMRDVTDFDLDSPIQHGPAVVQYNVTEQITVTDARLGHQRWTHPSNGEPQLPPPIDGIVSEHDLEHVMFLRVPFPDLFQKIVLLDRVETIG